MFSGVAVTLPALDADLHAGATALGLVETLFLAGNLGFLLPIGRLADAGAGRAAFAQRMDVAVSMLAVGDTVGPTHALSGRGDGGGRFG